MNTSNPLLPAPLISSFLALGALAFALFVFSRPAPAVDLHLVYMGNLDGELEPCGCTFEGDLGGIRRQATALDRIRQNDKETIFLHTGGLFNSDMVSDRIAAEFILSGFEALGFDAVGLQWKDIAFGEDFLVDSNIPWVASNWLDERFSKSATIQRGSVQLRYFQWLPPEESPYRAMQGSHRVVSDDLAVLEAQLKRAKDAGAIVVLGTNMDKEHAISTLPMKWVDIALLSSNYEQYGDPEMSDGTLFLTPGSRGQRIAELTLTFDQGKITRFTQTVTELPNKVADSPRMDAWYQAYQKALEADYQDRIARHQQSADKPPSPYAGNERCATCHQSAYKIWENSKHAHAFEALQQVNKAFDKHCLGCHTVGFDQPGGFIDPEITPDRMNVQCESCHGAAKAHVENPAEVKPGKLSIHDETPVCLQCHTRGHSPSFKVDTYWPRIQHGK